MNAYITLIKEKGLAWFLNRGLYNLKLKGLKLFPLTERLYEKKIPPIVRLNLFDYQPEKLADFLNTLSDKEKERIIETADLACKGIIKGFSSIKMDYGYPINWQMNPLTGKVCDAQKKWYLISDFDADRGDIKAIWEASRFSHFFVIARAYLLTQDDKYARAYFEQITSWVQENPYSFGANYKCGQECAFRLISCLLTFPCFQRYASNGDVENVKAIVSGSYRKILSNFFYAYRCIKNNHTISELVGMIIGAWCCEDQKMMKKAFILLDKVVSEQFYEDGGYIQQSFNYQRLALMDMEIILSIEQRIGFSISEETKYKILNSALQIYQFQDQSGDVPNYGSNDGALILPLTIGEYRDFKPGINAISTMIQNVPLYKDHYLDEELLWLNVTPQSMSSIDRDIPKQVTLDFPISGLSAFRNEKYWMMVVCKSEMHHMDNGHIDLWIDGKNVLCDAGSYSYSSEKGKELYSNQSHNTAYCKGFFQICRVGAFAVYGQPTVINRKWNSNSIEFDIKYSTGYRHKRKIETQAERIDIYDEVISNSKENYIQFHALGDIKKIDDKCIELTGCIIEFDTNVNLSSAKRSLYYLQLDDTICISVPCNKSVHTIIRIKS